MKKSASARTRHSVRAGPLTPEDKAGITAECEDFISRLKLRFLPEIRATPFNYPVDIFGKWRGSKYSFITRYRSGHAENRGEEFDAPFARLDHVEECFAEIRFDVMWKRHTGEWYRLHRSLTLKNALTEIAS